MVGLTVAGPDIEFEAFLFWVVLGFDGFGSDGGCFFVFLVWYEGLYLDDGEGGSFIFSLGLCWLSLSRTCFFYVC